MKLKHTPEIEEKINLLVETPEDLLPGIPPIERAVIIALKRMKRENLL